MWPEIIAFGAVGLTCMGAVIAFHRQELKRAARIARAEIGDRFKRKPRNLSIDLAMHIEAEVDMKWWQEQYDKLVRSIPTDSWAKSVERALVKPTSPTLAELDTSIRAFAKAWDAQKDAEMQARNLARRVEKMFEEKCTDCEYVEVHTYASQYVTRHKVATCQRCLAKELWS
ncbi:hypothetical protein SEA_ROMAN_91 [Microbacterium phage Roman]|nr:hypothetical protein SEA_ROMAN_91 [Microbacterium phage Roman]